MKLSKLGILIALALFALTQVTAAMGNKPLAKTEPKYKVEILKMEIVTATDEVIPQRR